MPATIPPPLPHNPGDILGQIGTHFTELGGEYNEHGFPVGENGEKFRQATLKILKQEHISNRDLARSFSIFLDTMIGQVESGRIDESSFKILDFYIMEIFGELISDYTDRLKLMSFFTQKFLTLRGTTPHPQTKEEIVSNLEKIKSMINKWGGYTGTYEPNEST